MAQAPSPVSSKIHPAGSGVVTGWLPKSKLPGVRLTVRRSSIAIRDCAQTTGSLASSVIVQWYDSILFEFLCDLPKRERIGARNGRGQQPEYHYEEKFDLHIPVLCERGFSAQG
jgi:hypothetical protein